MNQNGRMQAVVGVFNVETYSDLDGVYVKMSGLRNQYPEAYADFHEDPKVTFLYGKDQHPQVGDRFLLTIEPVGDAEAVADDDEDILRVVELNQQERMLPDEFQKEKPTILTEEIDAVRVTARMFVEGFIPPESTSTHSISIEFTHYGRETAPRIGDQFRFKLEPMPPLTPEDKEWQTWFEERKKELVRIEAIRAQDDFKV